MARVSISKPNAAVSGQLKNAPIDAEERLHRIAIAAYYRAEARGFAPGFEQEDWFEAEREINEADSRGKSRAGRDSRTLQERKLTQRTR